MLRTGGTVTFVERVDTDSCECVESGGAHLNENLNMDAVFDGGPPSAMRGSKKSGGLKAVGTTMFCKSISCMKEYVVVVVVPPPGSADDCEMGLGCS